MPGHAPGRSDPPVPEKGRALAPRSPGPLQALPLLRLRLGRLLLPGGRSGAPAGGVGSSGASQQGPYLGVLGRASRPPVLWAGPFPGRCRSGARIASLAAAQGPKPLSGPCCHPLVRAAERLPQGTSLSCSACVTCSEPPVRSRPSPSRVYPALKGLVTRSSALKPCP